MDIKTRKGNPVKCGIYRISIGPYFYVGSSRNIPYRLQCHEWGLKAKRHENHRMQSAYNQYQSFNAKPIKAVNRDILLDVEQRYIDEHYEDDNCLNLSRKALGGNGSTEGSTGPWGFGSLPIADLVQDKRFRQHKGVKIIRVSSNGLELYFAGPWSAINYYGLGCPGTLKHLLKWRPSKNMYADLRGWNVAVIPEHEHNGERLIYCPERRVRRVIRTVKDWVVREFNSANECAMYYGLNSCLINADLAKTRFNPFYDFIGFYIKPLTYPK